MLGTVVGASLSAVSSDSMGEEKGVTTAAAICGGILLLFGARLAAGCTRCVRARSIFSSKSYAAASWCVACESFAGNCSPGIGPITPNQLTKDVFSELSINCVHFNG